jgi:hypothetical protein
MGWDISDTKTSGYDLEGGNLTTTITTALILPCASIEAVKLIAVPMKLLRRRFPGNKTAGG